MVYYVELRNVWEKNDWLFRGTAWVKNAIICEFEECLV